MRKFFNIIGMIAVVLGGLAILGAAGALDCDTYTVGQATCQAIIGLLVLFGGLMTMAATNE